MRVGFTLIGGRDWTGGYNYLLNLVRVLRGHPDCGVDPVLFVGNDVTDEQVAEFAPLLTQAPIQLVGVRSALVEPPARAGVHARRRSEGDRGYFATHA